MPHFSRDKYVYVCVCAFVCERGYLRGNEAVLSANEHTGLVVSTVTVRQLVSFAPELPQVCQPFKGLGFKQWFSV
jgi:hypothetical protein